MTSAVADPKLKLIMFICAQHIYYENHTRTTKEKKKAKKEIKVQKRAKC